MNEPTAIERDGGSDDGAIAASNRYARLRDLFAAAVEIEPAARDAWIAAQVPEAAERSALKRLLAADQSGEGYLDTPADEHAARMAADEALRTESLIGTSVGAFRLARLLGSGGMAAVFLGERESGDFRQRVAVKLLRRGLYSDVEQRLFRRERQLLATLDHPHIAHLIDGGVTAAGIPFLVLEYVDGVPITQYAAERRLGVRVRVELFLIVCRAVEAAHRMLIVHRDIKPSNILVSGDGAVKLLDFGIAKLLEDDDAASTVAVFTPEYAAPEQLSGAPVTTATDVYGLGVLLHELLIGQRPQGSPTRRPSSLAGTDAAERAALPRTELLRRALRGDLDTILLKCLDAEPARRYTSAGALADDIQRHLAGKPVEAHPPSRWYRAAKFVQRHRGSVAVTAALVLAIFAALGLAVWQADVARHEAARAREVQGFVESLFAPLNEGTAPQQAPSLKELLQRGIERIDGSFHDDLRAQAELLDMFSRIQDQLGEVRSNRELSERAYRVTEKLYGADDLRTLETRAKHARILYRLGEYDEALRELGAVRTAMQANAVHGTSVARVLEDLSFVRSAQGAADDELIALNQQAVTEREADPASTPENLAAGYNNLALAYMHADQWDRGLELFQKAHDLFARAKGESYATAASLANIGGAKLRTGRWREALEVQMQAREMFRRLAIDQHQMLSQIVMGICETTTRLEVNEQAQAACDEAVAVTERVLGESHPRLVRALGLRASARINVAQFDAAVSDLERARAIAVGLQGDSAPALRSLDLLSARIDRLQRDYVRQRQHLSPSMAVAGNADAGATPNLFASFALACARAPADECGSDAPDRADKVLANSKFANHPEQLPAQTALAEIDLLHGNANAAIARIEKGLAIAMQDLGDKHSWIGEAHVVLGDAQAALGNRATADREYAAAMAILSALPLDHPLRVLAASRLAQKH